MRRRTPLLVLFIALAAFGLAAGGCGGGGGSVFGGGTTASTESATTQAATVATTTSSGTNVGFVRDLQGDWTGYIVQSGSSGNPLLTLSFPDTPENAPGRVEIKDSGCVGTATYTPAQDTPDTWAFSLTWQQGSCLVGTFTLSPVDRPDTLTYAWTDGKGTASTATLVRGGQPPPPSTAPPATTTALPATTAPPVTTTPPATTAPATTSAATTAPPGTETADQAREDCSRFNIVLQTIYTLVQAKPHDLAPAFDAAAMIQYVQGFAQRVPQVRAYVDDIVGLLQKLAAISPTFNQNQVYTADQITALDALYKEADAKLSGDNDRPWNSWHVDHC